ncbi:MAG TPA: Rieske 2Fe-2S domain-containing protein [Candidatus Limnocylindrales bacterium]|nr:Rieske 2Fe-2S domain-containing protein [Candidatus Limnocylindrales bacterium]
MIGRFLTRIVDAQAGWARPFGDFNHRWLSALFRPIRPVKDFLNGTWLGHPVHAALTDLPIGVLTVSIILDLIDQPVAADVALLVGVLSIVAAAVAGLADYTDTDGTARMRATVHATLMTASLIVFAASLAIRAGNPADRTIAIALVVVGYVVMSASAAIGGDVVFLIGTHVNRHAWRGAGAKWVPLELGDLADIPEGGPTKAKAGINTLVLVRTGETILALHETCAHAGGPLAEGTLVDGCIQCPWHGSRYRLTDGHVRRGPSMYDQPAYEVRRGDAGWEVRRRPR